MASSMHSLKQKETMPEALAPPPYWTSIISLFPIEKNFFFNSIQNYSYKNRGCKSQELNDEDHSSQNKTNFLVILAPGVGSRNSLMDIEIVVLTQKRLLLDLLPRWLFPVSLS